MTLQIPNDHRRIIPRWRNSWIAITTGELVFSKKVKRPEVNGIDSFQLKLQKWREEPSIENAAELVSSGLSLEHTGDAIDAAEFLHNNRENVMPAVLSIADEVLVRGGKKSREQPNTLINFDTKELRHRIHTLRQRLVEYPRNSLMWVDLSRAYAVIGAWGKARDAMARALILAPLNRFVLRSAARLYIHLDEPDRAHYILTKEDIIKNDPWLLAAEIATSNVAGKTSSFVRNSRDILLQGKFHPFHTAELSSALATLELFKGSSKKARKLFEASLESPTENSVAQSAWARRWLPTLELGNAITLTPRTYEAQAWHSYLSLDWGALVAATMDWLLDEPFSSRPAELGSYAAATGLEDYELAENITRNGLVSNPNDHGLINNYAYALAKQDKLYDALQVLQTASRPAPNSANEVVLTATEGLINIKLGNWDVGQTKYLDAITLAANESLHKLGALASIHYAREMVNIGQLSLADGINFAYKASLKFPDPDVRWLLQKLETTNQNTE